MLGQQRPQRNNENPHGKTATAVTPGHRPGPPQDGALQPATAPERRIRAQGDRLVEAYRRSHITRFGICGSLGEPLR